MNKTYYAIGLMSGSSLDGLDIAYCRLYWENNQLSEWKLLLSETMHYSELWVRRLKALPQQNALTFAQTDIYFSYYLGELLNSFIKKNQLGQIDFVASHGHTVFHDPSRRYSIQIGNGNALAATVGKTVICDFRMQDVALNGEGAPLAPVADLYLFPGYDYYMNIGGIANISANIAGKWLGFDLAPANQVFNFLAEKADLKFDKDGEIARGGEIDPELLIALQKLDFFGKRYPKSMSNEWIRNKVLPMFSDSGRSLEDQMRTAVELTVSTSCEAIRLIQSQENKQPVPSEMLLSGGGCHNIFLVEKLNEKLSELNIEVQIPKKEIIDFKEAMLVALLGLLRLEEVPNSIPEVTGAKRATVNGGVYFSK
jgi:anhydro-N-acetylmuramic acid kinase